MNRSFVDMKRDRETCLHMRTNSILHSTRILFSHFAYLSEKTNTSSPQI